MNDDAPPTLDKPTILVVDDTPDNLALMQTLLKDLYKVKGANNGERGLKIAASGHPPDLILLDIMMPGIDGYEVCRRLKADAATRDIPVIFLTAKAEVEDEQLGFELGAVDYITKPISPPLVLARVKTHLTLKASADFLRDQNAFLEQEVARRTREVMAIQDVTILALTSLAETRDSDTGNHIRRTQNYVRALARKLSNHPRFAAFLTLHNIELLYKSAPLHDIGKVGIPDRILLKPRQADAGRVRDHEDPYHAGPRRDRARRAAAGCRGELPDLRQGDRLLAPGEVGRQRLPAGAPGRRDPDLGAPDGGGRCLRRADQPAGLQGADAACPGGGHHPAVRRAAL